MLTTLLIATLIAAEPDVSADKCVGVDAQGEEFPTCFDPGNGLELGALGFGRELNGGVHLSPVIHGAVLLRTERNSISKEGTRWFNEHRFLDTRVQPDESQRTLVVTAYQGNFRRHLKEGFLLVPSTPPIRLPFPFDFSINLSLLRYERRVFEGDGYTVETGRAAILLDPIRSPTGALRLAFGPSLSHQLRVRGGGDVQQEFSPLTSLYVEFVGETDDGWWNIRANALAGYVFTPDGLSFLRIRSEAAIDRLIFAVNDQPVVLRLGGTYSRADAGIFHETEYTVSLGLVMRLLSPSGG
ncbi:MAG: hypothetical protein ACJ790_18620 [Myxococcaceae bacterium]